MNELRELEELINSNEWPIDLPMLKVHITTLLAANREQKAEIALLRQNHPFGVIYDKIQKLQAENYELRASVGEKWIDVKQELPPRSRVLVYFPSESTSIMDALFDGKDFYVDGYRRTKAVTHWMPLPVAPPTLPGEEK